MSSTSWRQNASVIDSVLKAPQAYSFFQAVRLLERAALFPEGQMAPALHRGKKQNPVALFVPPETEVLRFKTRTSLSFPNNEIFSIAADQPQLPAKSWQMHVNFMNLAGSVGVLPYHYTELILQRLKQKDESLLHFLDLFNHRTISLFYQAGTKYSLPIEYERKQLNNSKKNKSLSSQSLLSLIGLGTQGLTERLHIKDESLLYYSGLLTQKVRTSSGLKQILADYFNLPVRIQEFVGQWQELIPDIRTQIASKQEPKGLNASLGKSAMLGAKGWIAQGKIRILLGPLNKEQFYRFAPGTKALAAMNDMVKLYLGLEHDYEFVIEVKRADLPKKITLSKQSPPILSWNTWLSTSERKSSTAENETLKITVSANFSS